MSSRGNCRRATGTCSFAGAACLNNRWQTLRCSSVCYASFRHYGISMVKKWQGFRAKALHRSLLLQRITRLFISIITYFISTIRIVCSYNFIFWFEHEKLNSVRKIYYSKDYFNKIYRHYEIWYFYNISLKRKHLVKRFIKL